jgi:hypothetical protein
VSFYDPSARTTEKTQRLLFLGMFTGPLSSNGRPSVSRVRLAGMCLPSRCLAMGIYVTIFSVAVRVCQFLLSPKQCSCEDVMDVRVLQNVGNLLTMWATFSFSWRIFFYGVISNYDPYRFRNSLNIKPACSTQDSVVTLQELRTWS